ncbi:pectate lyase superfamily protein [Burkholderia multivorans]|uniref:glycosyl hydrolase family 28-related protein n=1 Tax=Burkholderia multivorans TaxID=87883 RepID=UPI00050EF06E|nr:glycosyl hydrolase family 28-related protein [Burkholderia multivorans]KGC03165.1 pectate lyase superfamily protein [Burkholderia multivorans]
MKKILLTLLAVPAIVFGQTYPSPTFSSLTLQNPLTVANGGTGATTATGTGSAVLSNSPTIANPFITGSLNATGLVTTSDLATQGANTILANVTASAASPTAIAMPSCSGAANALGWSSGSGPVCNGSINAATLGGATFASPGPIGSGTANSGAFTSLSASTSNPSFNYLASGSGAVARSYASKFGDVVSATDFGADPTGTVSSTAAIQAAINAVTAKGGTVFLPIGTYKMTAPLVFPNAQFVSLIGAGHGAQLVNSTGTSFDMITWTNPGAGNLILTYSTIANLSLFQNGASGSGAEINTQYASGVIIKGVYFGSLAAGGDGVKIVGNGSTYSHEIQIIDFSGRSSTGNAVIHMTGTASDNLISGGVYEGMFGTLYGIQLDNGVGTLQMQNLHISNFATNVISVGTMVGVLQATNCIFDNASLETAYFNGMTNAVFVNTHFMFPGSGHSGISLNNASGNQFKSTIVESASGANAAWAIVETGTSNSNTFDGLTTTGTFTSGIASLTGIDSVVNPTGHQIVLASNGAITSGGTLYFSSGPASSTQTLSQFQMPFNGYIRKVIIASVNAPGASQSYTATVQNAGASTGMTATISGASSFGATSTGFVSISEGAGIGVQVVASSGAAATNLRVTLVIGY